MKAPNPLPSVEEILVEYQYDPRTGVFTHAYTKSGGNGPKGAEAGYLSPTNKYRIISIKAKRYMAHRLACKIVFGFDPPNKVDHRDRDRKNNAIANLRFALQAENNRNASVGKNNKSGWKGVCKHGRKWRASISVDSKQKHLGCFETPELAAQAYVSAALMHYGEFASAG